MQPSKLEMKGKFSDSSHRAEIGASLSRRNCSRPVDRWLHNECKYFVEKQNKRIDIFGLNCFRYKPIADTRDSGGGEHCPVEAMFTETILN